MPELRPPASPGLRLLLMTRPDARVRAHQRQVGLGLVEDDDDPDDAGVVLREDRVDGLAEQLRPVPGGHDDVDRRVGSRAVTATAAVLVLRVGGLLAHAVPSG